MVINRRTFLKKYIFIFIADVDDYIFLRPAANENAKCFRGCIFNECRTVSFLMKLYRIHIIYSFPFKF